MDGGSHRAYNGVNKIGDVPGAHPGNTRTRSTHERRDMTRILVADPEEAMRILLREELLEEGYDVLETPRSS